MRDKRSPAPLKALRLPQPLADPPVGGNGSGARRKSVFQSLERFERLEPLERFELNARGLMELDHDRSIGPDSVC